MINSSDLADLIADANGLTKADDGKFKVKESPAREGRNPATGEPMQIAASRKLGFSIAKAVKDKLNH